MSNKLLLMAMGMLAASTSVVAETETSAAPSEAVASKAKSTSSDDFKKWRIGSYGEMLATFKDY